MSSRDIDELMSNFNNMVNNEVAYQFIEDISDASNILWNYLINESKLSFEERNFIIGFLCLDYIKNPFVRDKPSTLAKAIERFNDDNVFGVDVLDEYIDKYFQNALLINRYNNLNLNYSENLEIEDEDIVDSIYEVLTNSSFFNEEEKEILLKHLVEECREDIDNNIKKGIFNEYEYDFELIENLEYYSDNIEELDIKNTNFILELIKYYFDAFISSDFKINRLECMISSILEKHGVVPPIEKIEDLYEEILLKDEKYSYVQAIEYILEFVYYNDLETYDRFVNDKEYAIESLINFYKKSFGHSAGYISSNLNYDESKEEVFFINELARDILYNLVGDLSNNNENSAQVEYYFDLGFGIDDYYAPYGKIYNIHYEDMVKIQKICLISDYYNKYSDSLDKDSIVFNNIRIICENSREDLVKIFDDNLEFRKDMIESFVDDIFTDSHGVRLCSDIKTLEKINPFLIMEMSSNRAYQKKMD